MTKKLRVLPVLSALFATFASLSARAEGLLSQSLFFSGTCTGTDQVGPRPSARRRPRCRRAAVGRGPAPSSASPLVEISTFDGDPAAVVDAMKEQRLARIAEIFQHRLTLPLVMAVIVEDQHTTRNETGIKVN
jgi:hypothetical protein